MNKTRRITVAGSCFLMACSAVWLGESQRSAQSYQVRVPLGLDLVAPAPENNELTAGKVALGQRLFFDPVLSADGTMSCAACHQPGRYFTDSQPVAVGIHGQVGTRNVPSILNAVYGRSFFWDGRARSLEEQVLRPIEGARELGLELDRLTSRLAERDDYRAAFREAYGSDEISSDRVAFALASYVRTLRSGDALVDRFLNGEEDALSPEAKRGFRLFVGRANCGTCHLAPLFTDQRFHNTGVSWGSGDLGRFRVSGRDEDRGAFKTPSLRNVAMTAPYMHDGSLATLEAVIEHYDGGGTSNPHLDAEIAPLSLTAAEKRQLIAFLEALTEVGVEPPAP